LTIDLTLCGAPNPNLPCPDNRCASIRDLRVLQIIAIYVPWPGETSTS
jgi:hypothetical protein